MFGSDVSLYVGPGADPFCAKALETQLEKLLDTTVHPISRITSFQDCSYDFQFCRALFVPGGSAAEMTRKLTQENLSEIRGALSQHNVSYYGACAGAIFGASKCCERVPENRNCGFDNAFLRPFSATYLNAFPGTLLAPLFSRKIAEVSSDDVELITVQVGQNSFKSVFIRGPGFMNVDTVGGAEVISTFQNPPPSLHIVDQKAGTWIEVDPEKKKTVSESVFYTKYGDSVCLTASHPEIDSACVRSDLFRETFHFSREAQEMLASQLEVDEVARCQFLRKNFERLGLTVI